jgi:hypothetical protein
MTLCESISAYHGSLEVNPVFGPTHTGNNSHTFGAYQSTRHGIFFSNNRKFAALYGRVGCYRLNIRHTLDLENDNNVIWDFVESFDPHDPDERSIWMDARGIMRANQYWELFEDDVGERFVAYLRERGYDSATFVESSMEDGQEYESRTTVVFDAGQVKAVNSR